MARKRRRPADPFVTADFAAEVQQRLGALPFQDPPPGAGKLSAAIEALIAPYLDAELDLTDVQTLTLLGVIAWNVDAAGPEDGPRLLLKTRFELGRGQTAAQTKQTLDVLDDLCRRKRQLYPGDRRLIAHHEVRDTGTGYSIQVAGVMPAPDSAQAG